MKKLLLSAIFSLLCVAAVSASEPAGTYVIDYRTKINASGRMMISDYEAELQRYFQTLPGTLNTKSSTQVAPPQEPEVGAVVILEEGLTAAEVFGGVEGLESVTVVSEMDGVVVVSCRLMEVDRIAILPQVKSISLNQKLKPEMDYARPSGKVSDVQGGFSYDGETVSFDGTGVVVGLMDTGLEANHINFKNSDGSSRIQRLWYMKSTNGTYDEYTAETIKNFTTDTNTQSHATHVCGIMGGSYKGNGTFRYTASAAATSCIEQTDQPIPYYGVATGADLACAVGTLYTSNIIQGVTNVIDYAESVGKPAVVNLSLGHVVGPHDGSDAYCQALARLGKRGIICISAGNDGTGQMTMIKEITSATGNAAYLRTFPFSTTVSGGEEVVNYGSANGAMDVWSSNSSPVTVTISAFSGGAASNAIEIMTLSNAGTLSSSGNSKFSQYFSGTVKVTSGLSSTNNRWEVYIEFSSLAQLSTNTTHVLMVSLGAPTGTTLYAFGDDVNFYNKISAAASTVTACTAGSAVNSINDGACADNVVSVGAYTSRKNWGTFSSTGTYYYPSGGTLNQIAPFSSYGQKFIKQGETVNLPLVSAPGTAIISSYSSYYLGSSTSSMTGKVTSGSSTYWWGQMQGTSMSCPFVTGTIGLWLQAWPQLSYDDVMTVINKTSTYNTNRLSADYNGTAADKAKWGAGAIDALEGVKEVLAMKTAGITDIVADGDEKDLIVTPIGGGCYEVYVAGSDAVSVRVVDLQGRVVKAAEGQSGTAVVGSGLNRGIYILEVTTATGRYTRKISI